MSFTIINTVADMFYTVFGNPYIVALVIIGFVIVLLLSMKADLTVILMVIIPLTVGIAINSVNSNFINMPTWIVLTLFMMAGIIFSAFMIYLMR